MIKHNVGNQYNFLGHTIELVEKIPGGFGVLRYVLTCTVHGGCCTVPNGMKMECLGDELDIMECVREVDLRFHPQVNSKVDWKRGDIAEIIEPWENWGTKFTVLGPAVFLGQWWVPIAEFDIDDPDFYKEAGLKKVAK